MAQFDIYQNPSTASRKHYPFLVDIQNPYIEELATRIVIPLGRASLFSNTAMKRLTPMVSFQDEKLIVFTPQISSISKHLLKKPIGTISHLREELVDALDFAIFGI